MIKIFDPRDRMNHFWRLDRGTYLIGRTPDCDLYVNNDTVSRQHAKLEITDNDVIQITDLGSHNGTVVNGKLLKETEIVKHNDSIEIGKIELRVVIDDGSTKIKNLVSLVDNDDLSNITMLPMEQALEPLPSTILENKKVFDSIFEFGKMLILPGSEQEIFNQIMQLLDDVIPFDRSAVFNVKDGLDQISISTQYSTNKTSSTSYSISRTILNELLEKKEAILISGAQSDEKYAEQQSIISSGIENAIAVPLYDEENVFGVLYLDTFNIANSYTEDHLRIVATFGNMLASKIANNNLLKERREKEILEAELAVASQIQEQLLPSKLPFINGYDIYAYQIQCKQVGGDLYDVIELPDGRLLLVLADVSGKGIGAALLASNILAAFRAIYNTSNLLLSDAVKGVSEQLLKFSRSGDFATLFIAVFDPIRNSINYVNAGHNPPLVAKSNGKMEFLEASGIPIGMMDLNNWDENTMNFEEGDTVLIFSDGIPEAMNEKDDQFSDEMLEKILVDNREKAPDVLSKYIINKVTEFVDGHPRSDDITLMILQRKIN